MVWDYSLTIQAYNSEYSVWQTKKYNLTLTGTRKPDPSIVLSADSESVPQGKAAKLYIDAPNAQRVAIRYKNQGNVIWMTDVACENGKTEYAVAQNRMVAVGTEMEFDVATYVNDTWSAWSEPVYVTVTDKQQLAQAEIHLPTTVQTGQNFTVSFDAVENADRYDFYIGNSENRIFSQYIGKIEGSYSYTVNGKNTYPGIYVVRVTAYNDDYLPSVIEQEFQIAGERPSGPVITVNNSNLSTGDIMSIDVDTRGAEELDYTLIYKTKSGSTWQHTKQVLIVGDIYSIRETLSEGIVECKVKCIVLKNGIWSEWTDRVLSIQINPTLSDPVLIAHPVYTSGENIVIEATGVENATSYQVDAKTSTGLTAAYIRSDSEHITIPGYYFNEGEYTITVTADAPGYISSSAAVHITIEGSRKKADSVVLESVTGEQPSLNSSKNWKFSFDVSDTSSNEIVMRYWTTSYYTLGYQEYDLAEEQETISFYQWVYLNTTYCFSFSSYTDGKWSDWSPIIRVVIDENTETQQQNPDGAENKPEAVESDDTDEGEETPVAPEAPVAAEEIPATPAEPAEVVGVEEIPATPAEPIETGES